MKMTTLCQSYLVSYAQIHKKSHRKDASYIKRLIEPTFGNMNITQPSRLMIANWFRKVSVKTPTQANRALEVLHQVFNFAIDMNLYGKRNPASRIRKNKETHRSRYLMESELSRVFEALAISDIHPTAKHGILFAIFSGLRLGEIEKIRIEHINFEGKYIRFPNTKNGSDHFLPLTAQLLDIIELQQSSSRWLFPSPVNLNHHVAYNYLSKKWRLIRQSAGVPDVRFHDLRRTVASWMGSSGESAFTIGSVLNHRDLASTNRYTRLNLAAVSTALEKYSVNILKYANESDAENQRKKLG